MLIIVSCELLYKMRSPTSFVTAKMCGKEALEMERVFTSCALTALLLAVVWTDPNHGSEQSQEGEIAWHVLSPHNAEFAIALGRHLKSKAAAGENIFYSPLGISTALSMLSAGARGATHTQLFSSLGYSTLDQMQVNEAYKYALHMLNSQENVQLEVGNSVVVRTGVNPLPAFLNDIRQYFMGEVFNVDFKNPAEAKAQINQHIATKTHDKIKDLVKDLNTQMSMMLINWVYFRGQWLKPFNKDFTTKRDFYVDKNTKVEVDMMWATGSFDYYHDSDNHTTVLQLPYRGNTSMMIVLPDEGMTVVESIINKDSIMEWQNSLFKRTISLSMPKFSISTEVSLEEILHQMGIINAFENTANFSGISDEVKFKVSKVSHQAVLSVDETGTEAAAVTTLEAMLLSMPQTIKVNRPFFVFIMELSTKRYLHGQDQQPHTPVKLVYSDVCIFVMPDEGMTDVVESIINKDSIMEWQNSLFKRTISLSMPKFSISTEVSLEEILHQMGIINAFENTANFSGISEVKFKVSKVSHQAVLSVDETGTEAAAVTTLEAMLLSMPQTIKVNRPFFVFIMELSTKSAIFMGRINNPTLL